MVHQYQQDGKHYVNAQQPQDGSSQGNQAQIPNNVGVDQGKSPMNPIRDAAILPINNQQTETWNRREVLAAGDASTAADAVMENEYLIVRVGPDGILSIVHKTST